MQFLTILVATLLGGCALIFVLYPIYDRMRQVGDEQDDGGQDGSKQGDREGQGNHAQGDRKGRPYHTRNENSDRGIVGVGLAPTLNGTTALNGSSTLNGPPSLNGTPTLDHSLETSTNSQEEREQAARIALQEIELDFQLGNLGETDYRSLRERYMRRALLAMKSRHDREQELDEAIEEQLRRLRETDETKQSTGQNEL